MTRKKKKKTLPYKFYSKNCSEMQQLTYTV